MGHIPNPVISVLFIIVVIGLILGRRMERRAYLRGLQRSQQRPQAQKPLPARRRSGFYRPRMDPLQDVPDGDVFDWNAAAHKN